MKVKIITFNNKSKKNLQNKGLNLFSPIKKINVYLCIIIVLIFSIYFSFYKKEKILEKEESIIPVMSIDNTVNIEHHVYVPEAEIMTTVENDSNDNFIPTFGSVRSLKTMEELQKYLYNVDRTAYVTIDDLNINTLLEKDFRSNLQGKEPKILIFHTHSQEAFIDSKEGEEDDTIVGVGKKLAEILVKDYNIPVVHDSGKYDFVDGKEDRSESYQNMEPAVKKLLEKYPTIEIAIDLHRDGVPDNIKFVTDIEGKPTAKVMFFNGITRYNNNGEPKELSSLNNPYISDNLALSLQLKLTANEIYPDFTRKIYIKPYRYSLHLLPKSMLVEAGANTNTVEEAKNAMYPLAKILVSVLGKWD